MTAPDQQPPTEWAGPSVPAAEAPPTPPPATSPTRTGRRRSPLLVVLIVACVLLAVAASAFGVLWAKERGRADDLADEVAAFESEADARDAEEDARPDLMQIAQDLDEDDSGVEFSGDEDSLSVEVSFNLDWVEAYLDATGFPSATIDRMSQTRALDGTLEATGDDVTATWTYHPDDGLNIVFSVDE